MRACVQAAGGARPPGCGTCAAHSRINSNQTSWFRSGKILAECDCNTQLCCAGTLRCAAHSPLITNPSGVTALSDSRGAKKQQTCCKRRRAAPRSPVWQRRDEVVRVGHLCGLDDFLLAGVAAAEADIVQDGGGKQQGLLAHQTDLYSQQSVHGELNFVGIQREKGSS